MKPRPRQSSSLTPRQMLGLKIRDRQDQLELHGAEVARRAGLSPTQYNHYVNGTRTPNPFVLYKISVVLDVTVDTLLNRAIFLRERDQDTYLALRRFYEACEELTGDDLQVLADLAEMAARRRRENSPTPRREIKPAWRELARIHERLIPIIIRKFAPLRFEAEQGRREDGKLWLFITTDYPGREKANALAQQLLRLAKEQLRLPNESVETAILNQSKEGITISLRVLLGRPPWEE